MEIRPLSVSDVSEVLRIQAQCYAPHLIESEQSFISKLSAQPNFSLLAVHNTLAQAYVIALPSTYGAMMDLDADNFESATEPDCIYIHDIAVGPAARSLGAAKALLNAIDEAAARHKLNRVCLVAVAGAASYWQRHGYRALEADKNLKQKLKKYGDGAMYMVKQ